MGGGDPAGNPRLRSAIASAKAENMPKENIERGIKKGTGELEGVVYDEITYEGYGPSGVAVLVNCMTDNRNRTVAEVRHSFSKSGGNLGESGCVSFLFDRKGLIVVDGSETSEDELMELALDAGAEDIVEEESEFQVYTDPDELETVREALEKGGVKIVEASISMIPQTTVDITDEKTAKRVLNLLEVLEDNDDVQNVYANFDISDELMEKMA